MWLVNAYHTLGTREGKHGRSLVDKGMDAHDTIETDRGAPGGKKAGVFHMLRPVFLTQPLSRLYNNKHSHLSRRM